MKDAWIIDAEFDGLTPTKIHVLSCQKVGSKEIFSTNDYDKMRHFLLSADTLICHNIIRFDVPVLERLLKIKIKAFLIDTLSLSWYLFPNRNAHGLESWGDTFNVPKPEIDDWYNLTYEEYVHRCEEDVKINSLLWNEMWVKLQRIYEDERNIIKFLKYLEFKFYCIRLQEESRWKLDKEFTEESLLKLSQEREEKINTLQRLMPKVPVIQKKTRPKKPFKQDGTLSKIGEAWFQILKERKLPEDTQEIELIVDYEEPNPGSTPQIKAWLFSLGWKPETFKYVKNKETGAQRQIPQINKEIQKGGGICDSIKKLYPEYPDLENLEGLGIINHRIGLLSGFLSEVSEDGYLKAEIQGLTNTLRFKHKTIVNLPKVNRPFGYEVRGALIAPEGKVLCGADLASLEDRLKQHFIYPLDPEYVNSMLSDDFDPHLDLAVIAGMLTAEQVSAYKAGETKYKITRDIAKNGNYACQYGAYPPKLSITCGITLENAQQLFDAYWERNWAIKKVAESQLVREIDDEKWLYNPISGFWYSLRKENDRFSTLIQGTASYCFDLWVYNIIQQRPQLTGQFHDEVILCVDPGEKDEVTKILYNAIEITNKQLKLNRQLDIGEPQFSNNYAEIH